MTATLRRALALVIAAAALTGLTAPVATAAPAHTAVAASRGPSRATAHTDDTGASYIARKATVPHSCSTLNYPDGAKMVEMCAEYGDLPGTGWWSGWRSMRNIPLSQGGHSDIMRFCHFGFQHCSTYASDGDTRSDTFDEYMADNDTFWVEIDVKYGANWYCRRWFININGNTAYTTCP